MESTLTHLARAGLITEHEVNSALAAHAAGTEAHTIGFEMEALNSVASEIAKLQGVSDPSTPYRPYYACEKELRPHGFGVVNEGLFEIQSPPAKHAHPLTIATRGIVRTGWLPERANGQVTAHVNIGSEHHITIIDSKRVGLVALLRTVELQGGTTPNRLLQPLRHSKRTTTSNWNMRGKGGVYIAGPLNHSEDWRGPNNRIEFRSLAYHSPDQFGTILDKLYYLTSGLLAPRGSSLANIYNDFDFWLREYFATYRLPTASEGLLDSLDQTSDFAAYIQPYAKHITHNDRGTLYARTADAVVDLREELAMTRAPLSSFRDGFAE